MISDEQVTLTHPYLPDVRYSCVATQAWVWEESGWKHENDEPDSAAKPKTTLTPQAAKSAVDTKES